MRVLRPIGAFSEDCKAVADPKDLAPDLEDGSNPC